MSELKDTSVNLKDHAADVDILYLNKVIRRLDSYPNSTASDSGDMNEVFKEGVLALDSIEFTDIDEKESWIQNLEHSLAQAVTKAFYRKANDPETEGNLQNGLAELKSNVKCLGQLDEMYGDDEETLFVNIETGAFTSQIEWEEGEGGKILAYDIKKYRFKDARNKHFAFISRSTHQLSDDLDLINRHATGDPEAVKEIDSVPLPLGGTAKDFKEYFTRRIVTATEEIYSGVVSELDKENLGGYVRQFFSKEKFAEDLKTE